MAEEFSAEKKLAFLILEEMQKKNISYHALQQVTGIPVSRLQQITKGELVGLPSEETLTRIAAGVSLPKNDFFLQIGRIPEKFQEQISEILIEQDMGLEAGIDKFRSKIPQE